ncbi:MAG TPA: STAS domain-containing protein [Caulobacteraceae bacterium]|nr:STAS domain-containing protein [Caulobacteraceae bacterium]
MTDIGSPQPALLQLPASLDLAAASPLAIQLLGLRGQSLRLDAGEVRRLGGQCLQVLLAARETWASDGQSFAIANSTAEFAECLALMGASDLVDAASH